jgi:uncharacterized membrane protein
MNSIASLAVVDAPASLPGAVLDRFQTSSDGTLAPDPIVADDHVSNHSAISLTVNAPLEQVYERWLCYPAFPDFMRGGPNEFSEDTGCMTWRIWIQNKESAWDAEVSEQVAKDHIAWRSTHGRPCRNNGSVTFEAVGEDRTRVTLAVEFEFAPLPGNTDPLGALNSRLQHQLLRFGRFAETATS